jgi:hypothetical protein
MNVELVISSLCLFAFLMSSIVAIMSKFLRFSSIFTALKNVGQRAPYHIDMIEAIAGLIVGGLIGEGVVQTVLGIEQIANAHSGDDELHKKYEGKNVDPCMEEWYKEHGCYGDHSLTC